MMPVAVVSLLIPYTMNKEEKRYDLPRSTNQSQFECSVTPLPCIKKDNRKTEARKSSRKIPKPYLCQSLHIVRLSHPRLAQFQRGECKQCKHQGADPEANDGFRFAPAHLFEVVMQGSHLEDSFLVTQLVTDRKSTR